jgi:hypothetical protein
LISQISSILVRFVHVVGCFFVAKLVSWFLLFLFKAKLTPPKLHCQWFLSQWKIAALSVSTNKHEGWSNGCLLLALDWL